MPGYNNNIEIRSEEVQEILGHIPSRLIRYGITVIFSVIFVLFGGSFFFKYPDIIDANFEIVTENPPAEIIAKASGNLTDIFVTDSQFIEADHLLGVIQNSANTEHMLELMSKLPLIENSLLTADLYKKLPDYFQLGDLQPSYSALLKASQEYSQFVELEFYQTKIVALEKKKSQLQYYLKNLKEQAVLKESELVISEKQFYRDSTLFKKEVISESDLDKSKKALIQEQIALRLQRSQVINTELQINEIEQQITEYRLELKSKTQQHKQSLTELFSNLESRIAWWFDQYVLESPIAGNVAFNKIWSDNQFISAGTQVFSIIPDKTQTIIGRVTIASVGVGKIRPNHNVNLKFNNYPYQEFGMIRAKVKDISLIPIEGEYFIELDLPDTLITNYGFTIPFSQKMPGVAEIITEDLPLIARLFNPIKDILKSHIDLEPKVSQPKQQQFFVESESKSQQQNNQSNEQVVSVKKDSTLKTETKEQLQKSSLQQESYTYHIIAASSLNQTQLKLAQTDFKALGYNCTILKNDSNRFRLSVYSSTVKAEALMQLGVIRNDLENESLWLLKVPN